MSRDVKTVLLLGHHVVIDEYAELRQLSEVSFIGGAGLDDVRKAFARSNIDHVVMGAGIDKESRLEIVREILRSDTTTLHLKDRASGPESFEAFALAVLRGLADYRI